MAMLPKNLSTVTTISNSTGDITWNNTTSSNIVAENRVKIQGKMLTSAFSIDELSRFSSMPENQIKNNLAQMLAEEMMKSDYIEFTKQNDTMGNTIFRARCYVLPNDDVTLLRKMGY